jgi:hypothetical protein
MGVRDIYRDKASLGHLPVLRGQTLMEEPYRMQVDATTVGLWNFDSAIESALTTTIKDLSGNGRTMTLVHAPAWGALGPWGMSLAFDGTADYATMVTDGVSTGDFTVEVVCMIPAVGASNVWQYLLCGRYIPTETATFWMFGPRGNAAGAAKGKLILYGKATSANSAVGATAVDDGTWKYLVAQFDRTNGIGYIYINGVVDLNTGAGFTFGAGSFGNTPSLAHGMDAAAAEDFTAVTFSQVRYSTGIRSAAEILTNAKLMGFA